MNIKLLSTYFFDHAAYPERLRFWFDGVSDDISLEDAVRHLTNRAVSVLHATGTARSREWNDFATSWIAGERDEKKVINAQRGEAMCEIIHGGANAVAFSAHIKLTQLALDTIRLDRGVKSYGLVYDANAFMRLFMQWSFAGKLIKEVG